MFVIDDSTDCFNDKLVMGSYFIPALCRVKLNNCDGNEVRNWLRLLVTVEV